MAFRVACMTAIGNPVPIPLRHRLVRRLIQLYVGLICYGVSCALMIEARLGLDPWDVFHQGVARRTGLSIGTVVIIVGVAVLLLWIPLRQRPGIGTISNAIVIGLAVNWGLDLLPTPEAPLVRWGFLIGGIVLNGVATGLYIGARLGPGPRDGLMTGYVGRRPGRSIRLVRTVIEVTVLAIGWLLGGTVGWATLLYAISIGPLAQVFIPLFSVRGPARVGVEPARVGVEPAEQRVDGDKSGAGGAKPIEAPHGASLLC